MGDAALLVQFEDAIAPEVNAQVTGLDMAIGAADIEGIVETVPSFRALLVIYEPELISYDRLVTTLRGLLSRVARTGGPHGRLWTIPIAYGHPDGADMAEISDITGLSGTDIVDLNNAQEYMVYFISFLPGLPVLGRLPPALQLSRRPVPRQGIPPNRVLIGGMQSFITPQTTATGYYMLGQTPFRPYDRRANNPFMMRPGDRVRFRAISERELNSLHDRPGSDFLTAEA
jgi:KipI family sensor histidine kinase inhibitor